MHDLQLLIILVIVFALAFDFINGFHDTANAIATSVSTRALKPKTAIYMAAIFNFLGALYSTGVAKTIGTDIVKSASHIDEHIIVAALIGAIFWNLLTWKFGMPSSSSHALVGGIIGAVIVSTGISGLKWYGIGKIFLALILSPIVAIACGYIIMNLFFFVFGKFKPSSLNNKFKNMQVVTAATMAFSHGSNDAQKCMGIITLALLSAGYLDTFEVPWEVKIMAATAMALGTAVGGWKIIKTVGGRIFKLQPISGFAADLNSSVVIFSATLLSLPVSTTHVVSGSIMGVGSAKRISAVRWLTAQQMVIAWILTIPCSALVGAISYLILCNLFGI